MEAPLEPEPDTAASPTSAHHPTHPMSDVLPVDPQQQTDTRKETDVQDKDTETPTCRICRGEETTEEPLFYPCKCNGSIRFVHQECLMEWLSRSQKRHCELCKTPFRFTKLYDPQMPASVPFPVFVKQAFHHIGWTVMRVFRYILVAFVWLCWVPWTMRTMWRFMFWLGDGAWVDQRDGGFTGLAGRILFPTLFTTTSQLTPYNSWGTEAVVNTTNMSTFERWVAVIHDIVLPWSYEQGAAGLQAINSTQPSQSLFFRYGRRLLRESPVIAAMPDSDNSTSQSITVILMRQGTMLSDVKWLQNLSQYPALNRTIIDILEGQLITLFVMVLIILVFLIREWVVQQQPNLAAPRVAAPGLAIEGRPAAPEVAAPHVPAPGRAAPGEQVNDHHIDDDFLAYDDEHAEDETDNIPTVEQLLSQNAPRSQDQPELGSSSQRPPMPRHALDRASELQRVLEEERQKVAGDKWPGIQTFMDYWHRGDCQPERVLELIREEEREVELIWIVNAMKRLRDDEILGSDEINRGRLDTLPDGLKETSQEGTGSSDESWQVLEDKSAEIAAHEESISQEPLPSNVPNWLDAQNLTWPPADAAEGILDVIETAPATEQLPSDPIPTADTISAGSNTELADDIPTEPGPAAVTGERAIANATDDVLLQPAVDEGPLDDQAQAGEDAPPRDQVEEAVRGTLWDTLANLLWGNVELPPAEQREVANQLEPILQPEVEHEPPQQAAVAGPRPQGPAPVQGPQPFQGPAPAPVPAAPDPNVAAGLLQPAQDPEVLRAAREAGVDPEEIQAIEDADDLDGLVELIGLQGPIIALIQHGMVCGAIVTLVVFFGIWLPYVTGKVVLVLLSNPFTLLVKLPLRWTNFLSNAIIDLAILLAGYGFFALDKVIRVLVSPIGWLLPFFARMQQNTTIPDTAYSFAGKSVTRLARTFATDDGFGENDVPIFSVIAHESLNHIQDRAYNATVSSYLWLEKTLDSPLGFTTLIKGLFHTFMSFPKLGLRWLAWELTLLRKASSLLVTLSQTNPFKVRLEFPPRTEPFDLELIQWSTRDRVFAIILGYLAFYAFGSMYVKLKRSMRNANGVRDDALEILCQAGGVLKVILIISIEMIAFPLYCGLLLDIAMLPLFQNRSLLTRLTFAAENPMTSIFLHWFVGTCYMFHFALFVSMCRKAMRSGVLYFIRDPDDPTFHPVRDVLERNLIGQLRKILFSALVYGALVIVCLGAVVWSVAAFPIKVLPIQWSTLNPSTELPIDLIVLNFLIPVAIKVLDPSQGLESMYKWWFRRCARALRLSHFLFNERHEDEEGHWVPAKTKSGRILRNGRFVKEGDLDESPANAPEQTHATPPVSEAQQREGPDDNDASQPIPSPEIEEDNTGPSNETHLGTVPIQGRKTNTTGLEFHREGHFVRAPASDQVRIPRNQRTFLHVDDMNNRLDGLAEPDDASLHAKNNTLFQIIWLPPNFQLRLGLFIFLLWTFAAATGLGVTIVPLAFGRFVFGRYLPPNAPVNDVHAFCFGAYVIGGPAFLAIKYHAKVIQAYTTVRNWLAASIATHDLAAIARRALSTSLRALRVLYFYSCFGIILPALLATVLEFYVFVPLSTRVGAKFDLGDRLAKISFIQNWTVGVLYLRIIGRFIHNNQESRPARALFALVAPANNGATWWDPDVKLATRAFFLPSVALIGAALTAPLLLGYATNKLYFYSAPAELQTAVYRYSYPALAASIFAGVVVRGLIRACRTWRSRIRDEVYLIGERLHNFGEKRPVPALTDQSAHAE